MKALLLSIKPKWCAKIMNEDKTIEVRKGTTLYKAITKLIREYGYAEIYIYCSKWQDGYVNRLIKLRDGNFHYLENLEDVMTTLDDVVDTGLAGKVLAKFRCREVEEIKYKSRELFESDMYYIGLPISNQILSLTGNDLYSKSCLSHEEMHKYLQKQLGSAIYISGLEIFDDPKELSEFKHCSKPNCDGCPFQYSIECDHHREVECDDIPLTKAPQSWCYIEVI